MEQKRVLIIGGGFAGIAAAKKLAAQTKEANVHIRLVSAQNYFEYYPALYRIVTGASPIEVCVPLADLLPDRIDIITDTIESIAFDTKEALGTSGSTYGFDYLILAVGSQTNYFNIPGVESLSFGFKSIHEALALKKHIKSLFLSCITDATKEEEMKRLHVVIVGGGPTGVELAGDLSSYLKELVKETPCDPKLITLDLIEAGPRLLGAFPPKVSNRVAAYLKKKGVTIYLNRSLEKTEFETVYLPDISLKTKTVIWTAGTKINTLYTTANLPLSSRKKVLVDSCLRVPGMPFVYVVGDGAQTPYSGLAQTALYDGAYVGMHIASAIKGNVYKPYTPKRTSYALPIGKKWGVLVTPYFQLYGIIPYMIRHVIDFIFFAQMLPFARVLDLFWDGFKYRKKHSV